MDSVVDVGGGAEVVPGGCPSETEFAVFSTELVSCSGFAGSPAITGGGRSSPSAALRESCRAKSEACHHSKNLRAKIDVGSTSLKLERMRGKME